jgi:hypothetical protein
MVKRKGDASRKRHIGKVKGIPIVLKSKSGLVPRLDPLSHVCVFYLKAIQ